MNRLDDLIVAMPRALKAANASPPVEIAILNYNSTDALDNYIEVLKHYDLHPANRIVYSKYSSSKKVFRMSHARNLSVLMATSEYILISSCDILLDANFFSMTRELLAKHNPQWLTYENEKGVLLVRRDEFILAGGFDERLVFYGSEDRDLYDRLFRRNGEPVNIKAKPFYAIRTPDSKKVMNYGSAMNKQQMIEINRAIYLENVEKQVLIANQEGWGAWT